MVTMWQQKLCVRIHSSPGEPSGSNAHVGWSLVGYGMCEADLVNG